MRRLTTSRPAKFAAMVSLLVATGSTACRVEPTATDSSVQSLDNFAAGMTLNTNECKGNHQLNPKWDQRIVMGTGVKGVITPAQEEKYRNEVKNYLKAIPLEMQNAFVDFGGQIILSNKATEVCEREFKDPSSGQYLSEKRRGMESCMTQASVESTNENYFLIHHQFNAGDEAGNIRRIRHGGVRVIGLIYSQFFAKLIQNPDPAARAKGIPFTQTKNDRMGFNSLKRNLANAFLRDLATKDASSPYKLENLETKLLGAGSAQLIKNKFNSDENADLLATASYRFDDEPSLAAKDERAQQFADYVLGEAFDSANCSDLTRSNLHNEFPASEAFYNSYVASELKKLTNFINSGFQPQGAALADDAITEWQASNPKGTVTTTTPTTAIPQVANPSGYVSNSAGYQMQYSAANTGAYNPAGYAGVPYNSNTLALQQQQQAMLQLQQSLSALQVKAQSAVSNGPQQVGATSVACANGQCGCSSGSCNCAGCASGQGCSCPNCQASQTLNT